MQRRETRKLSPREAVLGLLTASLTRQAPQDTRDNMGQGRNAATRPLPQSATKHASNFPYACEEILDT